MSKSLSFFRYPGGKTKLRSKILKCLAEQANGKDLEYREPFFGGGSIGLQYMQLYSPRSTWINDKDVAISCIWATVQNNQEGLKDRIRTFVPSIESFYSFKEELLDLKDFPLTPNGILDIAFKKIAIHQMSYSGLGTKSGGPLGGKKQSGKYLIDCRWSPTYLCKKVEELHKLFQTISFKSTSIDFEELILDTSKDSLIYLDPPYYVKGNDLYQCGFTEEDHKRLAKMLKKTNHKWVLSYDDCPEIRELYSWANVQELEVKYSIKSSTRKVELLITK